MEVRAPYAHGQLLDIGCGFRPYRHVFQQVESYIGIDLPGSGIIDVYASALELPFRSNSFDTVLCNEVLEHVPEPATLLHEASRVLRPGGVLLLTTPQTWGLHHEPYDFFRYTPYGLEYLASKSGLIVVEVTPTSGLWGTWAQRLSDTILFTYLLGKPYVIRLLARLLLAPVLWFNYTLDKAFGKRGDTLDNILVARKP